VSGSANDGATGAGEDSQGFAPHIPAPVCGWVLEADVPARLAIFYGRLLKVGSERGFSDLHWLLRLPVGAVLQMYRPSRNRPDHPPGGRLSLMLTRPAESGRCLAVLEQWLAEARDLGARTLEPPRLEPFGAEAWISDPEGNRVLLLVAPPDSMAISI